MKRITTSRFVWVLASAACLGFVACSSSSQNSEGDSGTEQEGGLDATSEGAPGPEGSTEDGTVTDSRAMDTGPETMSSSGGDSGAVDAAGDARDASDAGNGSDASDANSGSEAGDSSSGSDASDASMASDASDASDASMASDSSMQDASDGGADVLVDAPADVADAAPATDASGDANDGGTNPCSACASGKCGTSLSAFGDSNTSGWNTNGTAHYDATSNTVVLCDGTANGQAGTLFYGDMITADAFTFAFDFKLTTTGSFSRADGIGFVMQTTGATAVGAGYGGFGFMGLSGYAVELDIFDSGPCDPGNGNHAGVDLLSACSTNNGIPGPIATSNDLYDSSLPNNGVGDIGDGVWRTATITLASGQMSVAITGSTGTQVAVGNLQNVALPGFVSGTPYYLGLSGGTGSNGLSAREEIANVHLTFGTTHCL